MPHGLPIFSADTREEAESIKMLFCTKVHAGELAGRYVLSAMRGVESDIEALEVLSSEGARMEEAYHKMKTRQRRKK